MLHTTLVVLAALAQTPEAAVLRFEPDLETARAASRESGRPLVAYFTFDT